LRSRPKLQAVRIAVLVNPASASNTESTLREVQEAAPALGLNIEILNATTIGEIDAAFAALARERPDALFVGPDGFFTSRRGQFATLTAVNKIPAISRAGDTFPEMHQSCSQLMFSKEPYRRCVRAFFPNLFGKGHARAYTQTGKSVVQNAVTMKIDLLAII
jgi:hypothetical protein